jgi:hypothetical protein
MNPNTSTFSDTNSPLIASDRVEGTQVFDGSGKSIGTIKRLMIDKDSGQVAYAVSVFGGFLGMGDQEQPLPWDQLRYDTRLGGYRTGLTEAQLREAPVTDRTDNWTNRDRERELHDYYGAAYYWEDEGGE